MYAQQDLFAVVQPWSREQLMTGHWTCRQQQQQQQNPSEGEMPAAHMVCLLICTNGCYTPMRAVHTIRTLTSCTCLMQIMFLQGCADYIWTNCTKQKAVSGLLIRRSIDIVSGVYLDCHNRSRHTHLTSRISNVTAIRRHLLLHKRDWASANIS
jgi:hypothetical protein